MEIRTHKQAASTLDAIKEVLMANTESIGLIQDPYAREVMAVHHAALSNLVGCVARLNSADMEDDELCPRCANPLHPERPLNSLSRVDNKTYICSPCGQAEALFNMAHPDDDLPPVTQPILG